MPRLPIALALPFPLPPLPDIPHPAPTPLQTAVANTLSSSDYDAIVVPLTNENWQSRWERLCLRPMDDEEDEELKPESTAAKEHDRERLDREADVWRKDGGLKREELVVSRLEETPKVIGVAADWLELDSPDEGIRFDSELALRAEMAHALYLSMQTIIIPAPTLANRAQLPSYARAISNLLQMGGASAFTQISIRIPVSDPVELIGQGPANHPAPGAHSQANGTTSNGIPESSSTGSNRHKRMSSLSTRPTSMHQSLPVTPQNIRVPSGASAASSMMSARSGAMSTPHGDPSSTWEMWDTIRSLCGYHPRLSVTLDLTNPLPPSIGALARWTAEPVKHIWLPATSFIPNAKGYPVLSKACQAFLKAMSKQTPTFILCDTTLNRHPAGGPNAYLQYIRHITNTSAAQPNHASPAAPSFGTSFMGKVPDAALEFASGYADYLQAPLQPLMDDLGSATYDVFERDPVKYRQYEEAIFLALQDLPHDRTHVVTVVGAGRGPLVSCTLRAMERSGRKAKVFAVEKNPNAYATLQEKVALEWHDAVEILYGDMRSIEVPAQADIMVSELLGSFGDNELSPECLDGAMRFLKPTGISIPASYTAHLAPISSSSLYAAATSPTRPAGAAETPYVVMMSAVNILSGDGGGVAGRCGERVQQCWQFEHPRRDLILDATGAPLTNSHNTRSTTLNFHIPHAGPLHGLAGYFESHLYSNIGLSIHPENMHRVSPEMFSWFPLFFPFKEPLYLPGGSELEVNVWRLTSAKRVWYEWCAEAYLPVSAVSSTGAAGGSNGAQRSSSMSMSMMNGGGGGGLSPGIGIGGGQLSPMMDAPFSGFGVAGGSPAGLGQQGNLASGEGRIKIGQTSLHNPGGTSSWVGL